MLKGATDGAFANATASCIIENLDSAPDGEGGVDDETQRALRGRSISSGMTTTWLIGFLTHLDDASDPAKFRDYFVNMLRFQGAYLEVTGGTPEEHLHALARTGQAYGLVAGPVITAKDVEGLKLPKSPWAAHASIWRHAVGVGESGGKWYLMDPACGLFVYADRANFLLDLGVLVEARRTKEGKNPDDTFALCCYFNT
jgi:hypothetical protein